MTNRKSHAPVKAKARAPRDATSFEEGDAGVVRRSKWAWLLLSLKITVGVALLVGAVGTFAYGLHRYAQSTPRFAIQNVEIEGTKRLARDDVLGAAGVKKGQNLFSLDITKAERSLLDSPWIASVRVTRRLPGTVRLQVVEHDPRAIAVLSGKNFLVAHDGTPFKELGQGDPHDFPLITGLSTLALARDRRAELSRLSQALGLLREYEALGLARAYPAQEVHLRDTGSVSLVVGEVGTTLELGNAPWKRKLLRAERVLSKTAAQGGKPHVVFLDNDAHPERVVVRVQ